MTERPEEHFGIQPDHTGACLKCVGEPPGRVVTEGRHDGSGIGSRGVHDALQSRTEAGPALGNPHQLAPLDHNLSGPQSRETGSSGEVVPVSGPLVDPTGDPTRPQCFGPDGAQPQRRPANVIDPERVLASNDDIDPERTPGIHQHRTPTASAHDRDVGGAVTLGGTEDHGGSVCFKHPQTARHRGNLDKLEAVQVPDTAATTMLGPELAATHRTHPGTEVHESTVQAARTSGPGSTPMPTPAGTTR